MQACKICTFTLAVIGYVYCKWCIDSADRYKIDLSKPLSENDKRILASTF